MKKKKMWNLRGLRRRFEDDNDNDRRDVTRVQTVAST